MKLIASLLSVSILLSACADKKPAKDTATETSQIVGTWKLVSALTITKGDTVKDYPVEGQEMIKILNATHFAFLRHDLQKGKGKNVAYTAGGGTYDFKGDTYTEHLAYLNYRDWEGRDFVFNVKFNGDTLVQKGIEKIDSLNINREIIETYVKVK
ncbi:lipocalin-like domain-containing protein [Mucilaginibacter sp. JRF]|uniref:lipocalin-like domain-containing protein n=1 Tax=Mucilaginibacter sp. JRF TaxID=2780088 RepID=UPI00187F6093|nr:lipocalin-like domain-containing protein [Mucilaginibacter sp. JRF]MBE9583479.1 lipocalin-like domain-containing protein [Mucilaginibacter sp. JRF]